MHMINTSSLVYDCPCCGQGGLESVRIKLTPPSDAIVCSECDRIWLAPNKVGIDNDMQLETVLLQLGLSDSWSNLECIASGVHWDSLDPVYQEILNRKYRSGNS